jgi:CMP/dCMP kinase
MRTNVRRVPRASVAIDGPVAGGKSTAARAVAARLGLRYVDTGAMYRALTHAALRAGIDPGDEPQLLQLLERSPVWVQPDSEAALGYRIGYGNTEVGAELFEDDVSGAVSRVAAHPGVRTNMVLLQRGLADEPVVMDAACKIFLTASVDARVGRRSAELAAGGAEVDPEDLRVRIEGRDRHDSTRPVAPLQPAADATVIDSSEMTLEQVVERIVELARSRLEDHR